MKRLIAERSFDCIGPDGERFRTVVRIGERVVHPRRGSVDEHGSFRLSMEPLIPEVQVAGVDCFQALCLAMDLVRSIFKDFVAGGGRVLDMGGGSHVNLDDPSFCGWPDAERIRREWGPSGRGRETDRSRASRSRRVLRR